MELDRGRGVLLYGQLATELKYRIAAGDLEPGDPLPSLREGERRWGVSLHTVRRAYQVLEEEGLVETRDRSGTRVSLELPGGGDRSRDGDRFARAIVRTARERFGWDVDHLLARLESLARDGGPRESVWVVECSRWLAGELARQLGERWAVDARPWPLEEIESAPPGLVVSTLYHHGEVEEKAGDRAPGPVFLTIELDPGYLARLNTALGSVGRRLVLCGVEPRTTRSMARDLSAALGREGEEIEMATAVTDRPRALLESTGMDTVIVCSPENWDALTEGERARPNVLAHGSRFRPEALERLGAERGWRSP